MRWLPLLILLAPSAACALDHDPEALDVEPVWPDPGAWTRTDTALEAAFGLALLADYLQTRRITREGREANPIMGPRGDRVPPEVYFPAVMGLHVLAAKALPSPWRNVMQGLSIGLEGMAINRNLGLGFGFRF